MLHRNLFLGEFPRNGEFCCCVTIGRHSHPVGFIRKPPRYSLQPLVVNACHLWHAHSFPATNTCFPVARRTSSRNKASSLLPSLRCKRWISTTRDKSVAFKNLITFSRLK